MSTPDEMKESNRKAMILAVIGGVLLLVSGTSGVAAMEAVKDFVTDNVADNSAIQIAFVILIFLASLGGIGVIIGGVLTGRGKVGIGRFLIGVGSGLGLIGLIIAIAVGIKEESLTIGAFIGIGAIGVLLSVAARVVSKKE